MFWTTNYLIWGVLFCVPYLGLAFFGPNYTLSIFNSKNITFPKKFFHITRISLEPYEGAMHFRWADILCQNWSWYQATALSSRLFSRRLSESRSPLQYLAARCGTKIFLLRCVGIFVHSWNKNSSPRGSMILSWTIQDGVDPRSVYSKCQNVFANSFVTSSKKVVRHSALPVHAAALWNSSLAAVATQSPQYRIFPNPKRKKKQIHLTHLYLYTLSRLDKLSRRGSC